MTFNELKAKSDWACEYRWNAQVVSLADAEAAIKAEREACAKVCETVELHNSMDRLKNSDPRLTCAAAIRARGETPAPLTDYDDGL